MASNLHLISSTDKDDIRAELRSLNIHGAHFTNGIYGYLGDVIVPKMLAGFQYVADRAIERDAALIIAVNSNDSVAKIMRAKRASDEEKAAMEKMFMRANKVGSPLSLQHPDRRVITLFYDEETPTALYNYLAITDFRMHSLHKWDFGTKPDAPKIEGAHNFDRLYAFPSIDDSKPVCYDITVSENQSSFVHPVKLQEEFGSHGAPYITKGGLLFPLKHPSLQKYAAIQAAPDADPAPTLGL